MPNNPSSVNGRSVISRAARGLMLLVLALGLGSASAPGQDLLRSLAKPQDFKAERVSSYDRTGGNKDSLTLKPGETVVLADLKGPGAIDHIWVTVAAEPFYGRKIVLRMFWDGESAASVEAPLSDFFGVGHGLDRNLSSWPIADASDGRARNCYWYMPFARSARLTATNEGSEAVDAFYYYVDYRRLEALPGETPYFHAQYRQEFPCEPGRNYLILEAAGKGHYVGSNLSVLQRSMGWWGEGDDMIFVDGEAAPSLHGTGSEDYYSNAWGMRPEERLFFGCPLQELDFQAGSKATVYRWHIPDPIPFERSIRVTIEHGHANDRADDYASTAYWYQAEPHRPFPDLPSVSRRLPFAWATPEGFIRPDWKRDASEVGALFADAAKNLAFWTPRITRVSLVDSAFYGSDGSRYPFLLTEGARAGDTADVSFDVGIPDRYALDLYFVKGPAQGNLNPVSLLDTGGKKALAGPAFNGYAPDKVLGRLTLTDLVLPAGACRVTLEMTGKEAASSGLDLGFVGLALSPYKPRFITEWNIIGPFDAPDMTALTTVYPPEKDLALNKAYRGKGGVEVKWARLRTDETGYMRLDDKIKPNENGIIYALAYVYAPAETDTYLLLGSDDGVRVWLNGAFVHSNPSYRAAAPDEDKVRVHLKEGWNSLLLKDLQGAGGWGFFARFSDPEGKLRFAVEPPPVPKKK